MDKNEMMRSMLAQAVKQQYLTFCYVLAENWFSFSNNLLFIYRLKKYFLMDLMDRKSNRLCQFAPSDRTKGQWIRLDKLPLIPEQPVKVWLKDLEIPVLLCKIAGKNGDHAKSSFICFAGGVR
jgi:hypothetical protein